VSPKGHQSSDPSFPPWEPSGWPSQSSHSSLSYANPTFGVK
jgi:hypothetical protein